MTPSPLPDFRAGRRFFFGVAVFLAVTAALKLYSGLLETKVLGAADPLLPFFTVRQMMFLAALLELAVAFVLFRRQHAGAAPWLVLWLVGVFAAYRVGLWAVGFQGYCSCLGHVLDILPGVWLDRLMVASLGVMGLGSVGCIAFPRRDTLPQCDHPAANRTRKSSSVGSHLALTAVLICVHHSAAMPPTSQWEVSGALVCDLLAPNGELQSQESFAFTACVSNLCWSVRVAPSHEYAERCRFTVMESSSDGTNTYQFTVFNQQQDITPELELQLRQLDQVISDAPNENARSNYLVYRQRLQQRLSAARQESPLSDRSINQAVATIRPPTVPNYLSDGHAAALWFAYCSKPFLLIDDGVRLPLLWPPDTFTTESNSYRMHMERSDYTHGFPPKVVLSNDGFFRSMTPTGVVIRPLPPPLASGYTNAVFEFNAFTNLAEFRLPSLFTLLSYEPTSTSNIVVRARVRAVVTYARVECRRSDFVPRLPVTTLVEDRRSSERRQFLSPPGVLPVTTDAFEREGFQREVLASIEAHSRRRRLLMGILLGLAIIAGPVVWYRKAKQ